MEELGLRNTNTILEIGMVKRNSEEETKLALPDSKT